MNPKLPAVIKKITLRAVLPAAAVIIAASITPLPAVCGAAPSSVTQSSQTYKDPVCNSMVKDLETEIAETTASLKDCGAPAPASHKAAAAKVKECEEYHRKLKLTKENLLQVKDQCDKGLTPGYLPKVIENPGAVPCAQCQARKLLQQDPPAKTLTGLPATGKVMDLKGSDPMFAAVVRKPVAAGIPDPGEPTVLCICANGRDLGWMLLSACQSSAVQSQCNGVTPPPVEPPPVVNPPVEPPPVVVPPTVPPPATQPPAGKPSVWAKVGNFFKAIGNWIWNNILKPIVAWVKSLFQKEESDEERAQREISEWKERSKGLPTAVMVCDGKGGFRPQLNKYADAPYGVADCTRVHEETHIKDFKASEEYKNWCVAPNGTNKPDGTVVEIEEGPFRDITECSAFTAGAACLKNKRANATTSAEKTFLTEQVQKSAEGRATFCKF